MVVHLDSKSCYILDSLSQKLCNKSKQRVVEILLVALAVRGEHLDLSKVRFKTVACPQQPNSCDCGTFGCLFCERIFSADHSPILFESCKARQHLRSFIESKAVCLTECSDFSGFSSTVKVPKGLATAEFTTRSISYFNFFKKIV